jgi:hypothetical protein
MDEVLFYSKHIIYTKIDKVCFKMALNCNDRKTCEMLLDVALFFNELDQKLLMKKLGISKKNK